MDLCIYLTAKKPKEFTTMGFAFYGIMPLSSIMGCGWRDPSLKPHFVIKQKTNDMCVFVVVALLIN